MTLEEALALAREEARRGMAEGNDPVGAVLLRDAVLMGTGRNRFLASGDPTTHAEMEAYRDGARRLAARLPVHEVEPALAGCTVVTTALPCPMCAGAIIRWRASEVVVAESATYAPARTAALMEAHGIVVTLLDDRATVALVEDWLARHPERLPAYRGDGGA